MRNLGGENLFENNNFEDRDGDERKALRWFEKDRREMEWFEIISIGEFRV
jgi:hypothetical protein